MSVGGEFPVPNEPWMRDAECQFVGGDGWFPEVGDGGHSASEAKQVCMRCRVRSACLEFSIVNEEREGIWGGVSARARRTMIAARRRGEAA